MKLRVLGLVMVFCLALALLGCTPQNAATTGKSSGSNTGTYLSFKDDAGREVTLTKKPVRVVSLSNSNLSFVDVVKGDLVGVVSAKAAKGHIPERFAKLPSVGEVYNVNSEALIGLKPDLVLANKNQHEKLLPILEANHIPVAFFATKSYADVKRTLTTIGKIYGNPDAAAAKIAELDQQINTIVSKIPQKKVTVAIIHATPSNVTVELDTSIAGDIAKRLGFTNVASGAGSKESGDRIPYSMEVLVAKNPDAIFITSMGDAPKIEARLQKDVKANPAWNSLNAVKNNKLFVLPENLFLLNPGLAYPKAVEFMAKTIYPEAF
jgi:iron complex transport system substrate-binding protein